MSRKTKAVKNNLHYRDPKDNGRPRVITEVEAVQELKNILEWLRESEDNLYIGRYAANKGFPLQALSDWATKWPPSAGKLYATVKDLQASRVIEGALKSKLNASFAKFFLENAYHWVDKQEVTRAPTQALSTLIKPSKDLVKKPHLVDIKKLK